MGSIASIGIVVLQRHFSALRGLLAIVAWYKVIGSTRVFENMQRRSFVSFHIIAILGRVVITQQIQIERKTSSGNGKCLGQRNVVKNGQQRKQPRRRPEKSTKRKEKRKC